VTPVTASVTGRFRHRSRGESSHVNLAKVLRKRIRRNLSGVGVDADVNAVVAANVGEQGQTTSVFSGSNAAAGRSSSRNDDGRTKR
jgi:hypothetical protein